MKREPPARAETGRPPIAAPPDPADGDAGAQRRVVAALAAGAELRETHMSYVFLTVDRAYKLKKAVVLPFADYGTRERRRHMCEEEVRLNRRLAPSVYRAVRAVVPDGTSFALADADDPAAVEHVVEMNRFSAGSTLVERAERGVAGEDEVDAVAQRLARFHAGLPPVAGPGDPLTPLRAAADETFRTLHELVSPDGARAVSAGQRFTRAFLAGRGEEIARRARAGFVREGHGDLRAEHVLLRDGVEIVDCLEFDPALRTIDVGADISFLVMDLELLGRPDLADALLRRYAAHGGDPGDPRLVAFHASQRAWVRAKVVLMQGQPAQAAGCMGLARRLAWRARGPFPLVVCGLAGTGKTTLARELGALSGLTVFSSDPVRKRLAGIDPSERARPEHYGEEFNRRTYAELGRLARAELEAGRGVVVDATFRRAADREPFLAALGEHAARARWVECAAPLDARLERSAERARAPAAVSDATPDVARAQSFDWLAEALPEQHLVVRTERAARAIAEDVEAWLDADLARGVSPRPSGAARRAR